MFFTSQGIVYTFLLVTVVVDIWERRSGVALTEKLAGLPEALSVLIKDRQRERVFDSVCLSILSLSV